MAQHTFTIIISFFVQERVLLIKIYGHNDFVSGF